MGIMCDLQCLHRHREGSCKTLASTLDPSNLLRSCIQDVDKVDAKYTRFKNILSCSNIDLGEFSIVNLPR